VLGRLAAGGVGVGYQGRHVRLDRPVAIRVVPQQGAAASPEWRRRFEREAWVLSALAHPNIVPLTDFGIDGDVPYLVTELVQGKTLAELINEGPMSPARALDIVRQTLHGLALAHRQAIAHLDLKPANILLQAPEGGDQVRLLDFGMARLLEGANGTPAYMAPEQVTGERVDTRADIYAAGVILFELLAGQPPYVADTPEGLMEAHVSQPVPSLATVRPDLSIARAVQPVINRAMAKAPAERYPQALWMLSALEALEGGARGAATRAELPPTPTRKAPPPMRPERRARETRSRSWRAPIALAVLAGAVTAGAAFVQRHRGPLVESARPVAAPSPAPGPQATATPPALAPPSPATAAATQTQTKPASTAATGRRARDPWQEGVPEALEPIRDRLEHGPRLNEGALGPAYAFARENPNDPRPWLLVGHAYSQLGWVSNSVERYQRAYRADSTCRGDPHMLDDLIKAATHRVAGPGAVRAIRDIYGAEALPALEKAIARGAGARDENDTLDHLRDALSE
jgi:serine/threonine-protein kinase